VLVRLVTVAIVANLLGSASIGLIAFAYSFIGLFLFLYQFGLDTAHMRKIADGHDVGQCIGAYVLLKTVVTTLTTGLILTLIVTGGAFGYEVCTATEKTVIFIILASTVIGQLFSYPLATFTARKEIARKATVGVLRSLLDLPTILLILLAFGMRNVVGLALGHLVNEILAAAIGIVLYRRAARAEGYRLKIPAWPLLRGYIGFSLPMLGSLGLGCLAINIDLVMVKALVGNAASGNYYVVSRISTALLGIAAALITLVMPTASAFYARGQTANIARLLRQSERFLSLIIVFPVMGMFVFAEQIMMIFGEDFTGIAPAIMRAFAVITFLYAVNRPLNSVTVIANRPWIDFHITIVLSVANVVLNFILIPQSLFGVKMAGMGALGSAVGTAILGFVGFMISRMVARYLIGIRTYGGIALHLLAASAIGTACWLAKPYLLVGGRWEILLRTAGLGALAFAAYIGLLCLLREFTREDLRRILDMVNPAKLKAQFAQEIFNTPEKPCALTQARKIEEPVEV